MTGKAEMTTTHREELRLRLRDLRERASWSNARIARELGISRASVSQLISGKYVAKSQDHHWSNVEQLLHTVAIEAELLPLAEHVDTATSRRITDALEWAHRQGDIALVYGLAGSGKTWAARRYVDGHAGVTYVCATPACNTVYALLRLLCRALEIEVRGSAARVESAVLDALAGSTARLLVLDEAHHLPQAVLDEARCLYDAAGGVAGAPFGLALLGNDPLRATLLSAARCAQIVSRIGRTVSVTALAIDDVQGFATQLADGEPGKGLRDTCVAIAAHQGALRRLVKVGRDALALAAGEGRKQVTITDLRLAEQVRVG